MRDTGLKEKVFKNQMATKHGNGIHLRNGGETFMDGKIRPRFCPACGISSLLSINEICVPCKLNLMVAATKDLGCICSMAQDDPRIKSHSKECQDLRNALEVVQKPEARFT